MALLDRRRTRRLTEEKSCYAENNMDIVTQAKKAERLRELHRGPRILILANAWDVISARMVEDAGFPAVASTSAGVAAGLGYSDGQPLSISEMLGIVGRVARAGGGLPTPAMETGYCTDPAATSEMAREE